MKAGFYIHIPFCRKKCNYCGFFSGFAPEKNLIEKYTDYVCKEILLYKEMGFIPSTIYIGGGTPSLLSENDIEKILSTFHKNFSSLPEEITIEANPEDVTETKALSWLHNGINRVSLGFQSMDNRILKFLGRSNTSHSNKKSFEILRNKGFKNISIDFIISVFSNDAEKLIKYTSYFDAEHYSIYSLSIDENTKLLNDYLKKIFIPKSDIEYIKDYKLISKTLIKNGYIHYEVSNFAKDKNYISKHNSNYWNYLPYVGIGIGAVGFYYENEVEFRGRRQTNVKNFRDYFNLIDEKKFPVKEIEEIDFKKGIKEFSMLGLRKKSGISLKEFNKIFGKNFYDCFDKEKINKLEKYLKISKNKIAIKNKYISVMNTIISEVWKTEV